MTLKERIEALAGTIGNDTLLQQYVDEASRLVIGDLPEDVLLYISADYTDPDGTTGVDVTGVRIFKAHKDGYPARRIEASLEDRLTNETNGSPVFYVKGNTGYVLPGGGTIVGVTVPTTLISASAITGFPPQLVDIVVNRSAQLCVDYLMSKERIDHVTTITLPSPPSAVSAPSISYGAASSVAPSTVTIAGLPTAPVYTAPSLGAKVTVPTVTALDLSTKVDGATALTAPTPPSAPSFSFSDATAATIGATTIDALPAPPTYSAPSFNGGLSLPTLPDALDLTTQIDGATAIQAFAVPSTPTLSFGTVLGAAISAGQATAGTILETGLAPIPASVTAGEVGTTFIDAISIAATAPSAGESITPVGSNLPTTVLPGKTVVGDEGKWDGPADNELSLIQILNADGSNYLATLGAAFKQDKADITSLTAASRLIYDTVTSDFQLSIESEAGTETDAPIPSIADIGATIPSPPQLFGGSAYDATKDPQDPDGSLTSSNLAYGMSPKWWAAEEMDAYLDLEDEGMTQAFATKYRSIMEQRAQYVDERHKQFQADMAEWQAELTETLQKNVGRSWEAFKLATESSIGRYVQEVDAIVKVAKDGTDRMLAIIQLDNSIRVDLFKAHLESAKLSYDSLLSYYNARLQASMSDAGEATRAAMAEASNASANDQAGQGLISQASRSEQELKTQATIEDARLATSAAESTARMATEASVSAFANLTNARISAAREITQASQATLQAATQASIASANLAVDITKSQAEGDFQASAAQYKSELERLSVQLQTAGFQIGIQKDQFVSNLQRALEPWVEQQKAYLQEYTISTQQAGDTFSGAIQDHMREADRILQQAQITQQQLLAQAQMSTDVALQNEIQTISSDLGNYAQALSLYGANTNLYGMEIQAVIQKYSMELDRQIQLFSSESEVDITRFRSLIENASHVFQEDLAVYNATIERNSLAAQIARQEAQQIASQATEVAVVNAAKTMDALIAQYQATLQKQQEDVRLYSEQSQVAIASVKTSSDIISNKLRMLNFDRNRLSEAYSRLISSYIRYFWPRRSTIFQQSVI